jgi:acetyl-CoA acetyltransferase
MDRKGVCFVGYGETPFTRPKGKAKSIINYLAESITMALDNAGIKKHEVNGLALGVANDPIDATSFAEWLGLELDWLIRPDCGGTAGVVSARRAADAIQLGQIDVVVSVGAASRDIVGGPLGGWPNYHKDNFAVPYGYAGMNSYLALILRRYMADYGLTFEQLGKVAVAQRRNAEFNENALFRSPLTMNEYLNSRIICDPLRLYDCTPVCNGASAFVMASERRAKELMEHPIYLVSDGEKVNYQVSNNNSAHRKGLVWESFAEKLFASVKREEIDFVEAYDAYTIVVLLQLHGLGFFEKGKVGEFLDSHDLTFSGDFPLNTGGGELSAGQAGLAGAHLPVVEAIRQLKGEASGHQVKKAKTCLVSSIGMPSCDVPVGYGASMILQRR